MRLIKGGQGRTDDEVEATEGSLVALLAVVAVVAGGVGLLWLALQIGGAL